jgi:endonuclease YncB( thermonuclease family)
MPIYLLYVWNEQGTFVNESLVSSGHAEAVLFPPNDKYWPVISQAEDAARQTVAGLCGDDRAVGTGHARTSRSA